MTARINLIARTCPRAGEVNFILAWAAPAEADEQPCAPARLETGDGHVRDLGLLCAPTTATWRALRQVDLVSYAYRGPGPYTAVLRWGANSAQAIVTPSEESTPVAAVAPPVVALFAVAAVREQPFQRLVRLRIAGVLPDQRLRLDGGAGQVHDLASAAEQENASEVTLTYAKPGRYAVALELLNADGFWLATLAETPVEITAPDAPAETPVEAPSPAVPRVEPTPLPGIAAIPTEPEPWLPYRNVQPTGSTYTYVTPGGSKKRAVNPGVYLSVRSETSVNGQRWFRTALGDWIAAGAVNMFQPSALRGVQLDGTSPPPPPPVGARRGIVTATVLNVRARPGVSTNNPPVATLRAGAEVAVYEEQQVGGAAWYRIGDARWVHSAYVRIIGDAAPPARSTVTDPRDGVVTAAVLNVRAQPGVGPANPAVDTLHAGNEVTILEEQSLDDALWYRIGAARWAAAKWIQPLSGNPGPSAPPVPIQLPLGWVITEKLDVYARPGIAHDNPPVAQLSHYERVPILEESIAAGVRWQRIGDGLWADGRRIGIARARPRPANIGANERWVGVNLAQQTAIACEGDRPVFATLIASGRAGTPTVQGIFRTWQRLPTGKMSGPGYYIEDVTWTCYFYGGYALHTAYWHDAFGSPRSHGCVNLSPHDAWWIYQWSAAGGPNSPTVYVYWS